jgi:hypothetical protein
MWLIKYFLRHRWKQKTISVSIVAFFGSLNLAALIQSHFCHSTSGYLLILPCSYPSFTSGLLLSGVPTAVLFLSLLLIFHIFCMSCPPLNPLCELKRIKLWGFLLCSFLQAFASYVHIFTSASSSKNLMYARIFPFLWNSKFRASFVISV